MALKHETEALVVGAGPVGMFAALGLARREIGVEVVEEEWRPAARSYALALHPGTLELLDEAGLLGELGGQGHRVDRMAFYEGTKRRAEVSFTELPGAYPFVLVLPQRALESVLATQARRRGVNVRWSHRLARLDVEGARPRATVERLGKESTGYGVAGTVWVVEAERVSRAGLVVGADGHRSMVRQALGAELQEMADPRLYAVFEVTASAQQDLSEVRVVLGRDTTDVLWPLGENRFRWSFELEAATVDLDRPEKSRLAVQVGKQVYPYLSKDDLATLLEHRAPWFDPDVDEVTWSVAVRFESRLATAFGRDGVWLAGDAAHLAPPVAVQSMNLGLAEAWDLADRGARVLREQGSPDLLEEYGRERHDTWRRLLAGEQPPEAGSKADPWVRDHAARIEGCLPASGEDLGRLLAQLDLHRG
ncbi:MAG: FAD-dependent monooxygenase [Thermoanaerobaculia bacterium]